ncbi:MAG: DUF4265 domain-containing protein [Acidobacteria bacterium]|nr:DUF4265 domain-containing protein [Acidobacteriota bacterium]
MTSPKVRWVKSLSNCLHQTGTTTPLSSYGCTFERADKRLVAIDVPPDADISGVYRALEEGGHTGEWDFEEGHYGHPL